jgi:hypothetical protein
MGDRQNLETHPSLVICSGVPEKGGGGITGKLKPQHQHRLAQCNIYVYIYIHTHIQLVGELHGKGRIQRDILFIFPLLLSKLSFLPRVCGSAASACH